MLIIELLLFLFLKGCNGSIVNGRFNSSNDRSFHLTELIFNEIFESWGISIIFRITGNLACPCISLIPILYRLIPIYSLVPSVIVEKSYLFSSILISIIFSFIFIISM